jgi:MFS family permease
MGVEHRMLQKILGDFGIDRRNFLAVSGLLVNVFAWLFFLRSLLEQIIISNNLTNNIVIWVTFYVSIIASSIIGAVLSKNYSGFRFLYSWMALGAISSLLPALITSFTLVPLLIVSAIFGVSFGLGMPSCLAFFSETTKVENRGRIGGIIFLAVSLSAPILAVPFSGLTLVMQSIIYAIWRGMGLSVYFLKPRNYDSLKVSKTSFVSVLRDRSFLLYFVAWLMFCLVDTFEFTLIEHFLNDELLKLMGLIEPAASVFAILIAGFMCDWIGRKKIVLSGFVSLGIAYATIGFLPLSDFSWYLYFVVDGVAWGMFYLAFVLILWGDLSQSGSREKYYALGSVPFFISYLIPAFLPDSFVEQISLTSNFSLSAAFSLASFFLFTAVMPLVFAPETLPEKKIELRRLRKFAEEAQKAKEKYERKMEIKN